MVRKMSNNTNNSISSSKTIPEIGIIVGIITRIVRRIRIWRSRTSRMMEVPRAQPACRMVGLEGEILCEQCKGG